MDAIEFRQLEKLYHYTSMRNAISILASKRLFMGKLSNMNDVMESFRPISAVIAYDDEEVFEWLNDAQKELGSYRQASFTVDGRYLGFAISSMWGHYADSGYGACIVLDKSRLISSLSEKGDFHFDNVKYRKNYCNNLRLNRNPAQYFKKNIIKIFFRKRKEWEVEQEFRVICKNQNSPIAIDISDSIAAVIICRAREIDFNNDSIWNSDNYKMLRCIAPGIPILALTINGKEPKLNDESGYEWYPGCEIPEFVV